MLSQALMAGFEDPGGAQAVCPNETRPKYHDDTTFHSAGDLCNFCARDTTKKTTEEKR